MISRSQVWAVTDAVISALDMPVAPGVLSEHARRDGVRAADVPALATALQQAASAMQLAYLRRTIDASALGLLVSERAFPVVLLAPAAGGATAHVLLGRDGVDLEVATVAPDGTRRDLVQDLAALVAVLPAQVEALVPVSMAPMLAAGADEPGQALSPGARLLKLLVREKRDILIVFFYASLTGLFGLALPLGVQAITQMVSGGLILQPVTILTAFVIAGTLASGVLQLLQLGVVEAIEQRIFARLSLEFTFRLPRLRAEGLVGQDLPELMNRFFEIITIQKALSKLLTETTTAALSVLFGLILLTFYHPYFTVFGLALVAGLVLLFRLTGPRGLQTSLMESKYKYRVAHWLEEMARTLGTFKFIGRSAHPVERMDAEITSYLKYRRKHFDVIVQQSVAIIVFKTVITGALLILGAVLVTGNSISLGQFVASELVIVTVLGGLEKMITSLSTIYDILTSVDKLGHVSDKPIERAGGLPLPAPAGQRGAAVSLRGVAYTYPGNARPSLQGLDLDLQPGEALAFTGLDGAGQSTALRLIAALHEGFAGSITVNGLSLRDLDRPALRSAIGYVPEDVELFEGTIEENVVVGRAEVSLDDVLRALELVGVRETVFGYPDGLGTRLTTGGRELPQTVARKLTLARAIAGRPQLLVVDDIMHHFDQAARRQLTALLTDPAAPWTLVAASHEPLFLAACRRIVLLEEGRIVRVGTYEELLHDRAFAGMVPASAAGALEETAS